MTEPGALDERLQRLDASACFSTGWAVQRLPDGERLSRNGDVAAPSASTRKVAILTACLREVEAGRLSLDERLVVEPRHQENDSGVVRFLRPGLVLTLYDALVLMIVVSDNAATALVVERVTLDAVNALCRDLGMRGTHHVAAAPGSSFLTSPTPRDLSGVNATTPDDMVLLLATIVRGAEDPQAAAWLGVGTALCKTALTILTQQQFRDGLPRLLPTGTVVAHKTGAGPSNESDVGIVFRDGRPIYAIAAYVYDIPVNLADGRPGRAEARRYMAELNRAIWEHFAGDAGT